jgi:hypothetical protein
MADVAQPKLTLILAFMEIHRKCSKLAMEEAETDAQMDDETDARMDDRASVQTDDDLTGVVGCSYLDNVGFSHM